MFSLILIMLNYQCKFFFLLQQFLLYEWNNNLVMMRVFFFFFFCCIETLLHLLAACANCAVILFAECDNRTTAPVQIDKNLLLFQRPLSGAKHL